VCDYCGCRSRPLFAKLGVDHEVITTLAGDVRRALTGEDRPRATSALTELAEALRPHSELEERTLYPELTAEGIASDHLYSEHEEVDTAISNALAGSDEAWAQLQSVLDLLARHIRTEEYDLFPAAHQLLSNPAWDRMDEQHHADGR
jgi:Uncharacterized conserved protein